MASPRQARAMVAGAHTSVAQLKCLSIYVHSSSNHDPHRGEPNSVSGFQTANRQRYAESPSHEHFAAAIAVEGSGGEEPPLKGNDGDSMSGRCSSSSSSIGENSSSANPSTLTSSNEDGSGGDAEVQSSFKGPLDTMSSLEDSLPVRRSISKFFSGKSRSFTSLSDAVSAKDLAKPENPYNKKRRNLLACSNNWDRHRFCSSRNSTAGISKKTIHAAKNTLALAVAMRKSEKNLEGDAPDLGLPPLPPQGKLQNSYTPHRSFSIRSFSLTDLQGMGCQPNFERF